MPTGRATREPRDPLALAVWALEVGDWPKAIVIGEDDHLGGPSQETTALVVLIRVVAAAMSAQAHGDVLTADRQYNKAAEILPRSLTRTLSGGRRQGLMSTRRRAQRDRHPLLCRMATIIGREQLLLDDLRRHLARSTRPRDHLIEACIQFQFEVHCCPFSWPIDLNGSPLLPDVTMTRGDLLWRATNLRQFAFPQKGDVSETVWKDLHAVRGLWTATLQRLAGRPLAPWSMDDPRTATAVRLGRLRAWQQARHWQEDLHYAEL